MKHVPLGPHTPWPNRAEASVKIFKHLINTLIHSIQHYSSVEPLLRSYNFKDLVSHAAWARNTSITYGGKTPLEIAFGRPPPDILDLENMTPLQTATEPSDADKLHRRIAQIAQEAYIKTRQHDDLRRDLLQKLRPSEGPFDPGQSVWYWDRDMSKIRGGEWLPARVIHQAHGSPMVEVQFSDGTRKVNQSKLRKNPDPWHDVVIPGLDGRDDMPTVPSADRSDPNQQPEPATDDTFRIPDGPTTEMTDLDEPGYNFWLHNVEYCSTAFQQYCLDNDQLSAVLGQDYPVSSPIFLDSTFSVLDSARCAAETQRDQPQVVWISVPLDREIDEPVSYTHLTLPTKA